MAGTGSQRRGIRSVRFFLGGVSGIRGTIPFQNPVHVARSDADPHLGRHARLRCSSRRLASELFDLSIKQSGMIARMPGRHRF